MERVRVDDVERWDHPMPDTPGYRPLSDALGATNLAMNIYELAPGEGLSGGLHTHVDQEELFYVLEGSVSFLIGGCVKESGDVVNADWKDEIPLGPGEAIRFAPGEIQHGYNPSKERARVLAFGAPANSDDIRSPGPCPACGESTLLQVSVFEDGSGMTVHCPDCGETTEI